MNKFIAGYGEFMIKHTVKGCSNRNEIKRSYASNLKRYPNIIDTYGGSEANVLMNLSSLGVKTRYASAFKNKGERSRNALNEIKRLGVDVSFV